MKHLAIAASGMFGQANQKRQPFAPCTNVNTSGIRFTSLNRGNEPLGGTDLSRDIATNENFSITGQDVATLHVI